VLLEIDPGNRYRLREIHVEGAEDIGEGVVRDLLLVRPGQYYAQSRVDDSQRSLFAVSAIRFASIQREAPPDAAGDSLVDLRVQITPAGTRAARGGIGWSTDQCLQTEARLTHRNLFGGAKRFEVTARLDNIFAQQLAGAFPCSDVGTDSDFRTLDFLLQGELTIPVFFSGRTSFRARLFGERESVPDVFIREGIGAQFGVTRQVRRGMSATLGFQPEFTGFDEESADIFFCVNFGFCTPEDIETVTKARWLSPLTLSWIDNRTDRPLQPTDGHYFSAELERAERFTGSQYRYVRLSLQAADFEPIERDLVLAMRVRVGVVEATRGVLFGSDPDREQEVIHPSKRFFVGGSQSVRGFGQNLLGPRVLVLDQVEDCPNEFLDNCASRLAAEDPGAFVQRPNGGNAAIELSVELRQSLSPSWGLVLFLDGGNVWQGLGDIRAPVWTPGAGIRFRSPVGPIRLDLGYDPTGPTDLPVVVSLERGSLIELIDPVTFDPFTFDRPSFLKELLRRLQIHFSIGEAF
jgi:outer membrane protein insertion porin family/translocation and assembly module TamA